MEENTWGLAVDGRIILKWNLKEYAGVWQDSVPHYRIRM